MQPSMVPPWLYPHDVADPEVSRIRSRLAGVGLELESWQPNLAEGGGVFVFSAWNASVAERVQELSRQSDRVIAVAVGAPAPSRGELAGVLRAGAADVVCWQEAEAARRVALRVERWRAVDAGLERSALRQRIIGDSPVWRSFLRRLAEAAMFSTSPVLLLGESGTGKEQLSRLVHGLSARVGQWVVVDCSTVEPTLSGSEFFGHEKGAFTGAVSPREGAFVSAHQGTLFLDEVGELPPSLQAQLLRVTQEKTYKRLGSNRWFESDFRLVSATHRRLDAEVAEQRFRFDFLQRISAWTFRVLPLCERPGDVLPLAEHFARRVLGAEFHGIDPFLGDYLLCRRYPGNVRELEQLVTRASCRYVGPGPLSLADLPADDLHGDALEGVLAMDGFAPDSVRAVLSGLGLKEVLRRTRATAIHTALEASDHNVQQAARLLRVTDRALQMELAKREAPGCDA